MDFVFAWDMSTTLALFASFVFLMLVGARYSYLRDEEKRAGKNIYGKTATAKAFHIHLWLTCTRTLEGEKLMVNPDWINQSIKRNTPRIPWGVSLLEEKVVLMLAKTPKLCYNYLCYGYKTPNSCNYRTCERRKKFAF